MPCTVSREEIEFYEKQENNEQFGMNITTHEMTTAVACALGKKLHELGALDGMPAYVKVWLEEHAREDREREE